MVYDGIVLNFTTFKCFYTSFVRSLLLAHTVKILENNSIGRSNQLGKNPKETTILSFICYKWN